MMEFYHLRVCPLTGHRYIALLHSPLAPATFWSGVNDQLWRQQERAIVARLPTPQHVNAPFWLTHAASVAAALPAESAVILVGHSGAGPLLPAIGRFARNREAQIEIAGYVFVDSDLPRQGCSRFDLFDSPDAVAAMRASAQGGWLAQWTAQQLAPTLGEAVAAELVLELPEVPLALYEEMINVPDEWPEAPCAYLDLSDCCAGAVAEARRAGWPTRSLSSHHFAPVSDPEPVAAALLALVNELDGPAE